MKQPTSCSFTLVLAGGGARGFAHVGVLRALEHARLHPAAVVGVSMGAVVGATYALNPDWYSALLGIDETDLPVPQLPSLGKSVEGPAAGPGNLWRFARTTWRMANSWGVVPTGLAKGRSFLRALTLDRDLSDGQPPVAVCATDLRTGERFVLSSGPAFEAVYASSAMAGLLPPIEIDGRLLVDGAYSDLVPVDVARSFGQRLVIAVDAGQEEYANEVASGLHAMVRALEICHVRHAQLRFADADLVLRPEFNRSIDVLDFGARRECVAAGVRAVRAQKQTLLRHLGSGFTSQPRSGLV